MGRTRSEVLSLTSGVLGSFPGAENEPGRQPWPKFRLGSTCKALRELVQKVAPLEALLRLCHLVRVGRVMAFCPSDDLQCALIRYNRGSVYTF